MLIWGMITGCSGPAAAPPPPIGTVSGVVTFNGKPLPKALVMFIPAQAGQSSVGYTDDAGLYQLAYAANASKPGAVIGAHRVEIRTGGEKLDAEGKVISESPEILPAKYNLNSTLTANVVAGANTINFDLKTK
jgi:hypothetical protein